MRVFFPIEKTILNGDIFFLEIFKQSLDILIIFCTGWGIGIAGFDINIQFFDSVIQIVTEITLGQKWNSWQI